MKLIAALSLQMPWMTLEEFEILSAGVSDAEGLSQSSKDFLRENGHSAFEQASRLVEKCEAEGIQILYPGHSLYPEKYFQLEDCPLFLTFEGSWPNIPSMAIVGSREPSRFSVDWLNENLPRVFEKINCLIVSGGARGIDQAAHLAAVRNGRATLVFLPSGLRNLYPHDLRRYKELILKEGGGFVSEYPPDFEMKKFHFIKRNRLIVASADVVFVAEARRKSGSMVTAKIAGGMSRTLCTLPASPGSACAQGSLDLVYDGAFPIRDHLDLTALLSASSRHALM